jgi:hypothetical protein
MLATKGFWILTPVPQPMACNFNVGLVNLHEYQPVGSIRFTTHSNAFAKSRVKIRLTALLPLGKDLPLVFTF